MIENIVTICGYVLTALMSLVIYGYLVSFVIPHLCVKWKTPNKLRGDRGIKKYVFPEGRSVVYEPELRVRRYMKQYALIYNNGGKFIRCRINERIRYIKYDVIVFGPDRRVIDVIEVSERITDIGYCKSVQLPEETSFVNVVIRRVDAMHESKEKAVSYSGKSLLVLIALITVVTVIESYVIEATLPPILPLVGLKLTAIADSSEKFLLSVAAGLITGVLSAATYCFRSLGVVNK